MKQIPVKKLDSTFIIEYYCEKCDESITEYTEFVQLEKESSKIF